MNASCLDVNTCRGSHDIRSTAGSHAKEARALLNVVRSCMPELWHQTLGIKCQYPRNNVFCD